MLFGKWHRWAWLMSLFLAGMVSCRKEQLHVSEATPIICQAENVGMTKGLAETTTASLQASGLGLFAWRTDAGSYFDGQEAYLENVQFTYDGGTTRFHATPAAYWPLGSWLSFFAYAPYTADVSSGALRFPSSDYVSGNLPRIQYTPSETVSSQVDLCLSAPVLDRAGSEGVVELSYTHVLTRIKLRARWTGTSSQITEITEAGKSVRMISASFENILGTNRLSYGRSSYQWDAPTTLELLSLANTDYTLSVANGCLTSTALPLVPADYSSSFVVNPDGYLYVLPQALTPGARLVVTYGIFDSLGDRVGDPVVVSYAIGELSTYIWPAGYEVTYSITITLDDPGEVEAAVTFDCNAGAFVAPGSTHFDGNDAGFFLGGSFSFGSSAAGTYANPSGASYPGSSAGAYSNPSGSSYSGSSAGSYTEAAGVGLGGSSAGSFTAE